eukprot:349862-Chlamydomonas_euryale.AAC.9
MPVWHVMQCDAILDRKAGRVDVIAKANQGHICTDGVSPLIPHLNDRQVRKERKAQRPEKDRTKQQKT